MLRATHVESYPNRKEKSLTQRFASVAILFCSVFMIHSLSAVDAEATWLYYEDDDGCPWRIQWDDVNGGLCMGTQEQLEGPCSGGLQYTTTQELITLLPLTWYDDDENELSSAPEGVNELEVRAQIVDLHWEVGGIE